MLEVVSNIPEVGHPPVTAGGVRFWLCPELGDASWPAVQSESALKACCCFAALLDFDLEPPWWKLPSTTCTYSSIVHFDSQESGSVQSYSS
jgi:hypothetical protein